MAGVKDTQCWAFPEEQVKALTGLSSAQLRYWRKTGFFAPTYEAHRFYSFRDLVGLRTIAALRKSVSLQELRKLGKWLHTWHKTPWSSLRFYLMGKQVFVQEPGTDVRITNTPAGQAGIPILMASMAELAEKDVLKLRERRAGTIGHIAGTGRRAVVAGTKILTSHIHAFADSGASIDEIAKAYPTLTRKDITAAIAFERQRRRENVA